MPPDDPGRQQAPVLALDIGATNLRCALVSRAGEVLAREAVPTPPPARLARTVADIARRVRDDRPASEAVIGVPGRVDYTLGALEWGRGQAPEWGETFSEERLGDLLRTRVFLANDADLATVGEARYGAARGHSDVVYLTISSGVGAGAFRAGRLFHGRTKLLEVALTIIALPAGDADEPVVLEDLASGHGLEATARRAGYPGSVEDIARAVRAGDPRAVALWRTSTQAVAAAAVNLAHLLLPEVIVLGGGVSRTGDLLLTPVRDWLARYGPSDLPAPIEVTLAALGDDAGLVGAAAWRDALGQGGVP
jgi:glucokinase